MAGPSRDLDISANTTVEDDELSESSSSDSDLDASNTLLTRQSLVYGLQEVDKLKSQVQEVHVPLEVFDYIDNGRNPQLYTKDCIEKALTKNEQVKGKIDAYRKFKAHMMVELNTVFPNELAKYRAIRGDERPLS